jgi:hypothetical protein
MSIQVALLLGSVALFLGQSWLLRKTLKVQKEVLRTAAIVEVRRLPTVEKEKNTGGGFPEGWRPNLVETELSVVEIEVTDTGVRYTLTNGKTTFYLTL